MMAQQHVLIVQVEKDKPMLMDRDLVLTVMQENIVPLQQEELMKLIQQNYHQTIMTVKVVQKDIIRIVQRKLRAFRVFPYVFF
jgi:hypothetical protein